MALVKTWVPGEILTAADMNTYVRDKINAILNTNNNLAVAGAGPHSVGGSFSVPLGSQLGLDGPGGHTHLAETVNNTVSLTVGGTLTAAWVLGTPGPVYTVYTAATGQYAGIRIFDQQTSMTTGNHFAWLEFYSTENSLPGGEDVVAKIVPVAENASGNRIGLRLYGHDGIAPIAVAHFSGLTTDWSMAFGAKLFLDGVGGAGDTGISSIVADRIDLTAGGVTSLKIWDSGIAVRSGGKIWLDEGVNTWIQEGAGGDRIDFYTGTIQRATLDTLAWQLLGTGLSIQATEKLWLDGYNGGEYIVNDTANRMSFYTESVRRAFFQAGIVEFSQADVRISDTKKLFLDGGTNDSIRHQNGSFPGVTIEEAGQDIMTWGGSTVVYFNKSVGSYGGTANCFVPAGGAGPMLYSTSLRAIKKEVQTISVEDSRRLAMSLRPITYRSIADGDVGDDRRWVGLIAEEVEDVDPLLATYENPNYDGLRSVAYDRVAVAMLPLVQSHEREIERLRERLRRLEAE